MYCTARAVETAFPAGMCDWKSFVPSMNTSTSIGAAVRSTAGMDFMPFSSGSNGSSNTVVRPVSPSSTTV